MKYYLIIIALSVWQKIEHLLDEDNYVNSEALESIIRILANNNGIDWDFTCEIKEYHLADLHDARIFRDGAMAVFDDQEDSGECLELVLISEKRKVVGPEL